MLHGLLLVRAVLAARMMGAKNLWNHNALFDYQDRYMNVTAVSGSNPGWRAITPFNEEMWDTYRAQFYRSDPDGWLRTWVWDGLVTMANYTKPVPANMFPALTTASQFPVALIFCHRSANH